MSFCLKEKMWGQFSPTFLCQAYMEKTLEKSSGPRKNPMPWKRIEDKKKEVFNPPKIEFFSET